MAWMAFTTPEQILRESAYQIVLRELREQRGYLDRVIKILETTETSNDLIKAAMLKVLQDPEIEAAIKNVAGRKDE